MLKITSKEEDTMSKKLLALCTLIVSVFLGVIGMFVGLYLKPDGSAIILFGAIGLVTPWLYYPARAVNRWAQTTNDWDLTRPRR